MEDKEDIIREESFNKALKELMESENFNSFSEIIYFIEKRINYLKKINLESKKTPYDLSSLNKNDWKIKEKKPIPKSNPEPYSTANIIWKYEN